MLPSLHLDFTVHVWTMVGNAGALCTLLLGGWKLFGKIDSFMKDIHRILEEHDKMYKVFPEMQTVFLSMKDKKANGDARVLGGS